MDRASDAHQALVLALGEQLSALISASRALTAEAASRFHPELQPAAYYVASWLAAYGPANAGAVADGVAMDKSAVSRLTRGLIDFGFVERRPDPEDGRGTVLGLTRLGRARVGASTEKKGALFFDRIEGWSDDDLAAFLALLRRFNAAPVGQ